MFIDYSNPDNVIIKHKDIIYHGHIIGDLNCFLCVSERTNDIPFKILEIKDKYTFVENIVGYNISHTSVFPPTHSKEDLIKVLDALNKEYDRQFGSEEYINIENCKNGDYLYVEDGKFKSIYIFRECRGNIIYRHAFYQCDCRYLDTDEGYLDINSTTKIRKATSNEIQTLNNALLVQKRLFWNPISKQLEKVESSTLVCKALKVENIIEHPSTPSKTVPDISIKTFIKPKKHYKLNFNN